MTRGRCRPAGGAAAVLVAGLLSAGCSGIAGFEGPDPLVGGPPIQKRTSPAPSLSAGLSSAPQGNPAPAPQGQLPPVPTPSTATSQAALAAGVSQPLDTSRDLRIGTPTAITPDQPLWRGTDPPTQPTARLNGPPLGPGTPPAAPGVVQTGGGVPSDTLDQALEQLKARRVSWQRLETLDQGGWRFRCAIPNPAKPDTERTYDASGTSALEAVRRVLDQMTLEQR